MDKLIPCRTCGNDYILFIEYNHGNNIAAICTKCERLGEFGFTTEQAALMWNLGKTAVYPNKTGE